MKMLHNISHKIRTNNNIQLYHCIRIRRKHRIIDIDVGYVYLCCKILQTVKALVPFDIIVRYAYFVGRLSETAASHLVSKVSIKKKVYPIVF